MANIKEPNEYLEIFYKKYKEYYSLFYPKGKNNKNDNTTKLNKAIYKRLDNIYRWCKNTEDIPDTSNNINLTLTLTDEYNTFIKEMIVGSLSVKIDRNTIAKAMNLLVYHGEPILLERYKVPKECIIVILTPISRYDIQDADKYEKLIQNLNKEEYDNFMKNPVCYKRNELNGLYSNASVYFPDQYYPDINLSGPDKDDISNENPIKDNWGTYKYDLKQKPIRDISIQQASVNSIIKTQKLSGIIFVSCCRSISEVQMTDIFQNWFDPSIVIKQYETFIQILNKCIYFSILNSANSNQIELDDKAYIDCDKISVFRPNFISKCVKPIEHHKAIARNYTNNRRNKSAKFTQNYIPLQKQLNELSVKHTRANSESMKLLQRIPLMTQIESIPILQLIKTWLCSNDPSISQMKTLFEQMQTFFKELIEKSDRTIYFHTIDIVTSILNLNLNYAPEIKIYSDLILIRDILISFVFYLKITGNSLHMPTFKIKLDQPCNIFLNGLDLTVKNITNDPEMTVLFTNINGNLYLRDNKLVGIPQLIIIDIFNNKICSYKLFDIDNNPIDLKQKIIDGINLADVEFFRTNFKKLDKDNPIFMSQMSKLFDKYGIDINTTQSAGYRNRKIKNNKKYYTNKLYSKQINKTKRINKNTK